MALLQRCTLHASPHAPARPRAALLSLLGSCVVTLVCLAPGPAFSYPLMSYSWDDCSPVITDKSWSGPGIYTQVISATNLYQGIDMIAVGLDLFGEFPDAWDFSDESYRPDACHPASAVAQSSSGTSCLPYPVSGFSFYRRSESIPSMVVVLSVDPSAPIQSMRYTLFRIQFDHSSSVAGEAAPGSGACGGAERPLCFIASGSWWDGPLIAPIDWDGDRLTWQGFADCGPVVPAVAKSWGEIKAQYR